MLKMAALISESQYAIDTVSPVVGSPVRLENHCNAGPAASICFNPS